MSESPVWIDVRSGAPGLPGPYLYESLGPYEHLKKLGNRQPKIILAVGSCYKRQCLSDYLAVSYSNIKTKAITFHALAERNMFLVDCELHERHELPRIKAEPSFGFYNTHEFKGMLSGITQIAHEIYFDLLAPFSSAVLLFVSDLGGIDAVTELLANWARRMMIRPSLVRPQVLLLFKDGPALDPKGVHQRISSRLLKFVRISDPTKPYSFLDMQKIIRDCFDIRLFKGGSLRRFSQNLSSMTAQAASLRQDLRFDFSAVHLRHILQSAIIHFSSQSSGPFNVYYASRSKNPVSENLGEHIGHLVRSTKSDCSTMVASALVMDAYPPGMHYFHPSGVYDELYQSILSQVERDEKRQGFCWAVKERFIQMADEHEKTQVSSAEAHQILMSRLAWDIPLSSTSCGFCLTRYASYTFDCKHRICAVCTVICGSRDEAWRYLVSHCPLCQSPNASKFAMKPPTAGNRVLSLGGWAPRNSWQFLKDLQRASGLTSMTIREHFDAIIANDSGVFLTIAFFLEGWTLAECKRHLTDLELRRSVREKIRFENGIEFASECVTHWNTMGVVLQGKKSTTHINQLPWPFVRSDILVNYDGGCYAKDLITQISDRLISYLFYIELAALPRFDSVPQFISLRVRCRVSPGPALNDLVKKLYARQVNLFYRGDEVSYTQAPVCTSDVIEICKNSQPFLKKITISLASMRSTIDIKIGTSDSQSQSISNCPYMLEKIISEQGLDSAFGRSDHQPQKQTCGSCWGDSGEGGTLETELNRLQSILGPLLSKSY
ncbi:hypothetical protein V8F33_008489 [Rhypophila sp. PSN 637]